MVEEQVVQEMEHVEPIVDLTVDDSHVHIDDVSPDPPVAAKTKG